MKRRLVLFGLGDFARVAHFYFQHDSDYEVVAYTVTQEYLQEPQFNGLPVVPFETLAESHPPDAFAFFAGVGYSKVNRNRMDVFAQAKSLGYTVPTYVCSKATTWPGLDVGEGSFIFENNVIQPFTKIGRNSVLWSGNHIGHDSTIGDHCFITSHVVISGNCKVGDQTFIGVNATVRDGITIGRECVIGAGTVILRDCPDGAVYKSISTPQAELSSEKLKRI
jgi:sugar O-acyltransferase (sialic acid O-acetyltransferase NeuD family)